MQIKKRNLKPPHTSSKLIEVSKSIQHHGKEITIGELTKLFGLRAIGGSLAILSLLAIFPGISIIAGSLIMILGWQSFNAQKLVLPRRILAKSFDSEATAKKLELLASYAEVVERYTRPRLSWLCYPPYSRVISLLIVLLGICIFIPLPMTNFIPALAILGFAIAFIERDGLLLSISFGISLIAITTCIVIVKTFINFIAAN